MRCPHSGLRYPARTIGGLHVTYIGSFVLLIVCVKLLDSGGPKLAAGVFTAGKVVLALLVGNGVASALILAVVLGAVSFGYFWLLDRTEGSKIWWLVLIAGALLLV